VIITLQNIDSIIFANPKIKDLLPKHIGDSWLFGIRNQKLKHLAQRARLQALDYFDQNPDILKKFINEDATVVPTDYHIAKDFVLDLNGEIDCLYSNFSISRNESKIYISTWR